MPLPASSSDAFIQALDASRLDDFHRLAEVLRGHGRTLADYYEAAGLIAAVKPEDAGYGSGWVGEFCAALGRQEASLSPSLAYRLLRFAEAFPGDKGAERVRELDGKVSWEIMMRLLAVDDAGKRETILRRAADEGLSSRKVMGLIREKVGYRRARGGRGGRGVDRPSSHPSRALRDLRILISRWPAVYAAWAGGDSSALKRAAKLKPGQLTDPFLDDLQAVAGLVEAVAQEAEELAGGLSDLLRALRKKRAEATQDE